MVSDKSLKISSEAKNRLDEFKLVESETYDSVILRLSSSVKMIEKIYR